MYWTRLELGRSLNSDSTCSLLVVTLQYFFLKKSHSCCCGAVNILLEWYSVQFAVEIQGRCQCPDEFHTFNLVKLFGFVRCKLVDWSANCFLRWWKSSQPVCLQIQLKALLFSIRTSGFRVKNPRIVGQPGSSKWQFETQSSYFDINVSLNVILIFIVSYVGSSDLCKLCLWCHSNGVYVHNGLVGKYLWTT